MGESIQVSKETTLTDSFRSVSNFALAFPMTLMGVLVIVGSVAWLHVRMALSSLRDPLNLRLHWENALHVPRMLLALARVEWDRRHAKGCIADKFRRKVERDGYALYEYPVVTEDGYKLTVHRIR